MFFQVGGIGFRMDSQEVHEAIKEAPVTAGRSFGQHRAEGNVKDLAGVELVEQAWPVLNLKGFRCAAQLRRNVVTDLVGGFYFLFRLYQLRVSVVIQSEPDKMDSPMVIDSHLV